MTRSSHSDVARIVDELIAVLLAAHEPGDLEDAAQKLHATADTLGTDSLSAPQLQALRGSLRRAANLVESGAALQQGWARVLGAAVSGYTQEGIAAGVAAPARVSLEG